MHQLSTSSEKRTKKIEKINIRVDIDKDNRCSFLGLKIQIKGLINFFIKAIKKFVTFLMLISFYPIAYAENLIPISNVDETSSGTDVATTGMNILQKEILPLVELGAAVTVLFFALGGLWKGYKEYQREKDMGPFVHSIIASIIIIVFGGAILYLLENLRVYTFS